MKICFILNPRSGRNARRPWLASHIRDYVAARSLDAGLVVTTRPRHATELAQNAVAAGCTRVIAVGGDGTMNEIAQALLHSPAALGLVPCGSGNGLALHLGLPTRLPDALALATDPAARIAAIDTGSANGRPFFNAMGSGFDADISRRFNHLTRRGLPAYARIGLSAFRARRDEWVVIHGGGQTNALLTLFVAVANSDQFGNHARIAPGARVDDGQLDLVAVRPVGFWSAVPLVARMFLGKISSSPRVLRLRGERFLIERGGPGLIHTDGETHETGALVEIKVHPRSLRLIVPPHSPATPVTAADSVTTTDLVTTRADFVQPALSTRSRPVPAAAMNPPRILGPVCNALCYELPGPRSGTFHLLSEKASGAAMRGRGGETPLIFP